uniref:lysophospholipid acyltransferase family protein n=1 Tax=Ndongobacter massiliensis TaxID=1871025 RepID=UPI00093003F7|nr:lysophospholipid acyltransferase family protein [Ndongobacter massiliensis]
MSLFYRFMRRLAWIFVHLFFRFRVENFPAELPQDPLILCANHKSMLDPVFLGILWPRPVYFLAKEELSRSKFMNWLLRHLGVIFIDRREADLDAMRRCMRILKTKKTLGIFPEGTRTKVDAPENMKEGVAFLALRAQCNVLCATIQGKVGFRKPITVRFQPLLSPDAYRKLGATQARKAMTGDIYLRIYNKELEDDHCSL